MSPALANPPSANSTSQNFVKKKAALTLLRLYRKHPEVIPATEWALRIVSIMDDSNLVRKYFSFFFLVEFLFNSKFVFLNTGCRSCSY